MSVKIPLTQGKFAVVDNEDAPELLKHKWCAMRGRPKSDSLWYAVRAIKKKVVMMHNIIKGNPPIGFVWDHKSTDGLDNREQSLKPLPLITEPLNDFGEVFRGRICRFLTKQKQKTGIRTRVEPE